MINRNLVEEEHKIRFSALASNAYQYMVPLCLDLEREKEAFEYTERSKSRAFLDVLTATRISPSCALTSELESLLRDEETYLAKLREIQTRHLRSAKISVEPGEVEKIFENLTQIYDKIEEFDPEYVFTRRGKPLSLNKIQNMLSLQKRNVVLIEYFITKNETYIFTLSSINKKLQVKAIPLSEKRLFQYIENYRREVANYPDFKDIGQTWIQLSNYLIDPVSEYVTEDALIYFVPYGVIHYLPLHALEFNGEPLIETHPVAYVPSASLLKFCQNKGSNNLQSCASFGVDPYGEVTDIVEEGARDVANLFETVAYTGGKVTKAKVRTCLNNDIIHFLCHGKFDASDPISSGVILHDGVLTAKEIFSMRLNTELVTLAACETGISERSRGDELIGLTRAFIYAGAPSVIVSLWPVDACSTQELMLEFYTQLKSGEENNNTDKATALQQAQIKVMEKEEYSHPYYWAPFILVGDWR